MKKKGKTTKEITVDEKKQLMRQAFEIQSRNPELNTMDIAQKIDIDFNTVKSWKRTPEWKQWTEIAFAESNKDLSKKIIKHDDKLIDFIDRMLTDRLSSNEIKVASTVYNFFRARLEMGGLVGNKKGEVTNNFFTKQEVNNNINIESMSENELLNYITKNELPEQKAKKVNEDVELIQTFTSSKDNRTIMPLANLKSVTPEDLGIDSEEI